MKKLILFIVVICLFCSAIFSQSITLQDIWASGKLYQKSVWGITWMKNGGNYTSTIENGEFQNIVVNDIATGKIIKTIIDGSTLIPEGETEPLRFDGFEFNSDESKILFTTETKKIYRRSSSSVYYLYDISTKKLSRLSEGKQMFATYSPDASKVAFVRDNNLFYVDLVSNKEYQITDDGATNNIINGWCDWVYEEEFSFAKAFKWSPKGDKIAFYRFDESSVRMYNMQIWGDLYPEDYRFKYPKAGESNSLVDIYVFDINTKSKTKIDVGSETDQYIPRIFWTNDNNKLFVYRMNRLQNKLEILNADVNSGKTNTILTETDSRYVEVFDDVYFISTGFIIASEKDGYKHLYYYDWKGTLINQITKGNWDVDALLGVDEKSKIIYYSSAELSPTQRNFYSIMLNGTKKTLLTPEKGSHDIDLSPDKSYYLDYFSNANTPLKVNLFSTKNNKLVKTLEDNASLKEKLTEYKIAQKEFFNFSTSEGVTLNGWMIKPINFDKNKKYPVLMHVYGGPGHNTVNDSWEGQNHLWYSMLTQKDYIVVSIDNRGTGFRGADFKKSTYRQLGKLEAQDQIEGAKYLQSLSFVDKNRIGIWGWSFGGYMTSLCLTLGSDFFKMGIAVAPVTNWRFYDSIYTERYLGLPDDNPEGYDENSPITHADKLKGKYLIIHGTGDDNVHFQNAVDFQNALIKANKKFDCFFYPNRNHGIYGGNTRLHLYTLMTDYVIENL